MSSNQIDATATHAAAMPPSHPIGVLRGIFRCIAIILHPSRALRTLPNLLLFLRLVSDRPAYLTWCRLFEGPEYLCRNPDVEASGLPATFHYLVFGDLEGRAPSSRFDSTAYRALHTDVDRGQVNSLLHYCLFGQREGRGYRALASATNNVQATEPSHALAVETAVERIVEKHTVVAASRIVNNFWPADLPLVSVVIPCFNYGAYIEAALESVLRQTLKSIEIIIVDGGSDDGTTVQALRAIEAKRIPGVTFYYRKGRHLAGDNRNFGISRALGRYICCLDPDDILLPIYLEICLFLAEGFGYDLTYCSTQCFGASDFRWMLVDATFPEIVDGNQISTVAVFRKSAWAHAGGFRDWGVGAQHIAEDWEFWVRLVGHGFRPKSIREPLLRYRVHPKSLSNTSNADYGLHSKAIREVCEPLFAGPAEKHEGTPFVLNRWINTDRPDSNPAPGFLVCLPFVTIGGAESLIRGIAEDIRRKGYKLIVVTTLALPETVPDHWTDFRQLTDHVYNLPTLFHDPGVGEEFLLHLVRRYQIKTLFFAGCSLVYDLLPRIAAEFPNLVVVDQLFNDVAHAPNNRRHRREIRTTIVPSEILRQSISSMAEGDPGDVRVIPHSVPIPPPLQEQPGTIRTRAGLPADKLIVAFFGRLSPEKGAEVFVEMANELAARQDVHFVMTGEGPEKQRILDLIDSRGLTGRIFTPGFVQDIGPLMAAADIVVLTSHLDGMPLVLLESMARGKSVVASAVGSIPSVITDGVSGFLCTPGHPGEFTKCVNLLCDEPSLRQRIGEAARATIVEGYGEEPMLRAYWAAFGHTEK